jgi:hypothetical protein
MGGGGTTKAEQKIVLSPEAQQALSRELQLFAGNFLPQEMGVRGDIVRGLGQRGAPTAGSQGTDRALHLASLATGTAGKQAHVAPENFAGLLQEMDEQRPEAQEGLQQMFRQLAMKPGNLIDPRFAQFLRPDVSTSSQFKPSTGSQVTQGAGMALAAAGLVVGLIAI